MTTDRATATTYNNQQISTPHLLYFGCYVNRVFIYLLDYKKNILFDFDGELKIRYVRYKHLTKITIKVQLFWRLPCKM